MNPAWEQHRKKIIAGLIVGLIIFCCCCNWERWGP